ncbi:MAG: GGDEF domain-containing protein, partial [Sphaerochaeta sp.]|nr:GGDEF domain-containing protein [Sphaerochaeta sp.]
RRMNLFVVFWLIVHTALAFSLKPQYALDDTINCLCFSILGTYLGNMMVYVRLHNYDAHRLLVIEKETDILTGLLNRRKLFETLSSIEKNESNKPSGILLFDIDHFKEFNDEHGHISGDQCLNRLGAMLKDFERDTHLQFYRFGGEEFLAMAYAYDKQSWHP